MDLPAIVRSQRRGQLRREGQRRFTSNQMHNKNAEQKYMCGYVCFLLGYTLRRLGMRN